ncbi:multidrug resistance-associated protein 1-like [Babylonia areolata]|uniref:multidrug resistance-associated protein 1-like n=1 Tax=Babylonia areolata TaxID=304850 RepID=UPI003FD4F073
MHGSSNESAVLFCDTPLWEAETWTNGSYPRLTECFRQTVLVYVPCVWLWLTSLVHVRYVLRRLHPGHVCESLLNLTKLVMCLLLTSLTVAQGWLLRPLPSSPTHTTTTTTAPTTTTTTNINITTIFTSERSDDSRDVPVAYYVASAVQASTFLYAALLTRISRKALIVSPCVLFIFWTMEWAASAVPLYTALMDQRISTGDQRFLLPCGLFSLLCLQLVLSCWGEASLSLYHGLDPSKADFRV